MRLLVTGGRDYDNRAHVNAVLDALSPDTVIHGGASGADRLAADWARRHSVREIVEIAEWSVYGREAGPIRNAGMLRHGPDLVVAFPGGKGTANMIRTAVKAGVPVLLTLGHDLHCG